MAKIFEKLIFRGLHEKHAVQRGSTNLRERVRSIYKGGWW
jgi:hypothetical protein